MPSLFGSISQTIFGFARGRQDTNSGVLLFNPGVTGSKAGEVVSVDTALEVPAVQAAVSLIADGIAQLPTDVFDVNLKRVVNSTILNDVSRRPNPYQSPFEFKKAVITSLLLYGNAYILVARTTPRTGQSQRVIQMIVLPADKMRVFHNALGFPTYRIQGDADTEYAAGDIIHMKDIPDFTPVGKSRTLLAADAIGAFIAAERFEGDMFRNGINSKGAWVFQDVVDAEKREQYAAQMDEFRNGGTKSGKDLSFQGNVNYIPLNGLNAGEAQLQLLKDKLIAEIAAIYRVPPFMIGGAGDDKYNNVGQKLASLYRDTFAPLITNYEQAFSLQLLPSTQRLTFNVSSLTRGDRSAQVANVTALVTAGIMTPNEAREELAMTALDAEGMDETVVPGALPVGAPPGDQSTGGNGTDN